MIYNTNVFLWNALLWVRLFRGLRNWNMPMGLFLRSLTLWRRNYLLFVLLWNIIGNFDINYLILLFFRLFLLHIYLRNRRIETIFLFVFISDRSQPCSFLPWIYVIYMLYEFLQLFFRPNIIYHVCNILLSIWLILFYHVYCINFELVFDLRKIFRLLVHHRMKQVSIF